MTESWPPIAYENNGQLEGMGVELTEILLKSMPAQLSAKSKIEVLPFTRAFNILKTRENALLFTVARTPEREKLFYMLGPLAHGESILFALENSKIDSSNFEELKSTASVATVRGSVYESQLRQHGFKNIVLVNSTITPIKLLMSGRVDLICEGSLVFPFVAKSAGYPNLKLKNITSLGASSLYYAFSKGTDPEIIAQWKQALIQSKKNGSFKKVYSHWFKHTPAPMDVLLVEPRQ